MSEARQIRPAHRPAHLRVPDFGVGLGLRAPHYAAIQEAPGSVGFFEAISENYFGPGGRPLQHLDRVRAQHPLVLHGVSLSIGGPDEPNREYLENLRKLVRRVRPPWVSDHFCFCGAGGAHLHDLLPLPYTAETVERVARRARLVQDFLEVPFALENTSSYLTYSSSQLTEWDCIGQVAEQADCGLLFDVNNVWVSAFNHGFEPRDFVRGLPHERILQIHLAGHTDKGTHLLDTHSCAPIDPVLELYRETLALTGPVSTLLEWDEDIPAFSELLPELARIASVRSEVLG
ncbi:MAG TPA: DUF692 domain-containing protein [Polyangiaceae bacterium]|nr:DUF692 domain-containing protein [Polyangiaceae bacterium]